ncbi:MAG: CAP domain-containing protein [Symploca sp. SIO2G7]|nr:CAP domain-containing protein [Symploca sp. SIO2G7]
MLKLQLSAIAFLTILLPTNATADDSQQIAQNGDNCRRQQILTARNCAGDGLESEEAKLHQLVNQYRAQNGLPPIPISPSLTLVANRHVRDLDENIGQLTHGWSNCFYSSSDSSTWPCMWEAPQRFGTPYPGNGYENAHGGTGRYRASAESALRSWQGSNAHNNVILNRGIWQDRDWNALGIGIYRGYAVLWFGQEPDPAK